MTTGVALLLKAPVPGEVKTRLCPPLSPAQACELAEAMIADVAATVRAAGLPAWVVYAGPVEAVRAVLGGDLAMLAQRGEGLGPRLTACQRELFAAGLDRLVLLGGDVPTVDPGLLAEAVDRADHADVVLGPARDGGYTLMVTHRPTPELFAGVDMGTDRVLAQTLARAGEAGMAAVTLAPRHDLDTVDDLERARAAGELAAAPATTAARQRLLGHRAAAPPSPGGEA